MTVRATGRAALMLVRSVVAFPEGLIVDPDCVRVGGVHGFVVVSTLLPPLSVKLDGSPALCQLAAREGDKTVLHGCCAKQVETRSSGRRQRSFI